jgi:mannitol 2-dehydrogenase
MSCDNLQHNGDVCRRVLLGFLECRDHKLAKWVEAEGAFPNSMGDRITPATTDAERERVHESFGIDDGWPVVTEPFRQWVIEDLFANGRPTWEQAGAQLVQDVTPYEKMKIRLLNGGHQVLCFIGMLLGYRYAPTAMNDADLRALVQRFMDREVTPLLPPVPGIDLEEYKRTLLDRFGNPAMNDQLGRIGTNGSARIAEFVLPTAVEQLRRGGPVAVAAFTVAAWIRYLAGRDDQGDELPFADPLGEALREHARRGGSDASRVLSMRQVFGKEVIAYQRFADEVKASVQRFYGHGARATLKHCLERTG